MMSNLRRQLILPVIIATAAVLMSVQPAGAAALEQGERLRLRVAAPFENNSGFRVWGSKYYPGDVLAEKMTEYFYRRVRDIPRVDASLTGSSREAWRGEAASAYDVIVKINLEDFRFKKTDTIGSRVRWGVSLRMYVYNAATRDLIFDTVIEEKDERHYILYNDVMEKKPVYWEQFERTPCWDGIRRALDLAFNDIAEGYNGYRVVGRVAAKAERVDGSLSVAKRDADKLWHITIGREDSLRMNDIVVITRASSVRTIDPEKPEMHFPQVVGRARVVFLKGQDAVIRVTKESSEAPIMLGDAVSIPLMPPRNQDYL